MFQLRKEHKPNIYIQIPYSCILPFSLHSILYLFTPKYISWLLLLLMVIPMSIQATSKSLTLFYFTPVQSYQTVPSHRCVQEQILCNPLSYLVILSMYIRSNSGEITYIFRRSNHSINSPSTLTADLLFAYRLLIGFKRVPFIPYTAKTGNLLTLHLLCEHVHQGKQNPDFPN